MRFVSICPDARGRSVRARAGIVALCALAAGIPGLLAQQPPPATYRARTDLVVLQVSVVDAQRRFVTGLRQDDFSVYEEGARQEVMLFASSVAPLDVVLLIDTSVSMTRQLSFVQEAAIDLLGRLRDGDRAALILFNTVVNLAHALSADRDSVARAVLNANPAGATALHEAVYIALKELDRAHRADAGVRRQALVVLTDGADNRSRIPYEHVLEEARASAVTIFTILPGLPLPRVMLGLDSTVLFEMRQLAEDTGGRSFVPTAASDLAGVYDEIASELREQYWLAYVPSSIQPGFRRVSVQVHTRPGVRARTRSGYNAGHRLTSSPAARRVDEP